MVVSSARGTTGDQVPCPYLMLGRKYSWLSREALSLERETRTISRSSRVFTIITVSE
jgi:hypothetical protein